MNNQSKLNQDLLKIFHEFIEIMQNTEGVMGAWSFGSLLHGLTDEYSDIDVVFLVEDSYFSATEESCSTILEEICDKVILCWEEDFNNHTIINNGYLLKMGEDIFQFDIFLLNNSYIDDYMCKIHYSELSAEDIIFDNDDMVLSLCEKKIRGELWPDNIERLMKTYWYHFNMTAKYLLRGDYFKLNGVMRTLFDVHASLLLTAYDTITWGGVENKLHFIPEEKQKHLKNYYCTGNFKMDRENLMMSLEYFEGDLQEICQSKTVDYDPSIGENVKKCWADMTKNL